MKISYFFPVFEEDDAKDFFETFLQSKFYAQNSQAEIFVCACELDKKNVKHLSSLVKKHNNVKLFLCEQKFEYNDAFSFCLDKFDGDILLLGDCKIKKIEAIFSKCIEKNQKGANVVHVCKKRGKLKSFFVETKNKIYNLFVWLFTGKKEKCNQISLGLIDKNVVDILKTLKPKACFLKNTKSFFGFNSRTIYIDEKIETYEPKLKTNNSSMKLFFSSIIFSAVLSLLILFLCLFAKNSAEILIIMCIFFALIGLFVAHIFWQKHKFDVRNMPHENTKIFKQFVLKQKKK